MRDKWLRSIGAAVVLLGIGAFLVASISSNDEAQTEADREKQDAPYSVVALPIPDAIDLAGEYAPLTDPDVRERLDRELLVNTYWQSNGLLLMKRTNRYFPRIEELLAEEKIPLDFKYLALAESGLDHVVSPSGAAGFWQIMKTTGRELGLRIDKQVDERYHLEKATRAACSYLKDAYKEFGSWTLAAASYNMGVSGLKRQMERQACGNYYDLLLNKETSRYVFRILALKKILEAPGEHGFSFTASDLYAPFSLRERVLSEGNHDLMTLAKSEGISYKSLIRYNPWLRSDQLTVASGEAYILQFPMAEEIQKETSTPSETAEPLDSSVVE